MHLSGAFASSLFASRQVVDRILQDNLPNTELSAVFRQELQNTLDRRTENGTGPPNFAQLPALACEAVGGDSTAAVPVTVAWQLVRLAAKLLDDVEDRDVDHRLAITLNAATSLIFAAPLVLDELLTNSAHAIAPRVIIALERAMLRAAAGQHTDLAGAQQESSSADPDTWLDVAQAKSGELFAWACWAGALAGRADEHSQECLRQYGSNLGVLVQVADDFNGIWRVSRVSDLERGCLSLPVCYARLVLTGEARENFEALFARAGKGDKAAEAEVVKMLTDLGAQAYLLTVARVQYCQAVWALQQVQPALTSSRPLIALLEGIMPMLAFSGA